jgi:hypothetical protein
MNVPKRWPGHWIEMARVRLDLWARSLGRSPGPAARARDGRDAPDGRDVAAERPRSGIEAAPARARALVQAWWRSRVRVVLVPLVVVAVVGVWVGRGSDVDDIAPSPEAALAGVLATRGLTCDGADVAWVSRPRGVWESMTEKAVALVRARVAEEPSDLYLVHVRVSPEGAVLDVGDTWNVTETSGADESRPVVQGRVAVYTTTADGLCTGLHVLNLGGRPPPAHADFTAIQRAQIALTNLQRTGQSEGVVHDTFALDPVARHATFAWHTLPSVAPAAPSAPSADGLVEVHADDRTVVIDPLRTLVVSGDEFVHALPDERARPGSVIPWAVDRVRAMPSFGDDRMQWVKAVAFTALDRWRAQFSGGTTAQDVSDELGLVQATTFTPTFTDPEIGWPPLPMKTGITPLLPGEGQWIALDKDAFITPTPSGAAPAFVTSFVRPDVHRQDVRVYVTLWDPRQVALHIEAGTVEPIGASGEHGPGLVPRTPEVMKRLVAGFNGGFQAQHGEFGMQANGIEYLPPKPYAATVVELRDGSNAFGAWPGPDGDASGTGASGSAVPDDIIAFRQNLTALVQNGKYNPWGRTWWGGTPPGWADRIHSTRSGICLTSEGFVGYFYSASISAEDLAQGMLYARCAFGIHLDMNPGHAGFEFYNVAPEGQFKPLGRPLQGDWEAEGRVPDMGGYAFRSRRMIRGMWHMLFPRYIQREARDFFYLTARPLLPGAPVDVKPAGRAAEGDRGPARAAPTEPEPDEGQWHTKGLPQHGFPYALATTWVRAQPSAPAQARPLASGGAAGVKLRVLRADPRTMKPAVGVGAQAPTVLSLTAGARGSLSLWWSRSVFSIAASAPAPDATALVGGVALSSPLAPGARSAVGVQDEDGMLVWIEIPPDGPAADARTAAAMDALLERLGCSARMSMAGDARALLGGSLDLSGTPLSGIPPAIGSRLVRDVAPGARTLFDSTPIVPAQVWQPLQAKRVRYFYKPQPSAAPASSAVPGPTGSSQDP